MEVVGNNGRLVSKFILFPPLCVCALMHVCIHTLCVRRCACKLYKGLQRWLAARTAGGSGGCQVCAHL